MPVLSLVSHRSLGGLADSCSHALGILSRSPSSESTQHGDTDRAFVRPAESSSRTRGIGLFSGTFQSMDAARAAVPSRALYFTTLRLHG